MVFSEEPTEKPVEEDEIEKVEEEELDVVEEEDIGIEEVGEIEIMRAKVYTEAAAYEQRIPDNIQRVDALNDFISSLDPSIQSDPYAMRTIRTLVETLFYLKQSTVEYDSSGDIKGTKQMSASTLVDLIQRSHVPMGRAVLRVSKKEYYVHSKDEISLNRELDEISDNKYVTFTGFMEELQQMNEKISNLVSGQVKGAASGKVVTEWYDQRNFLNQFLSPWRNDGTDEPLYKAAVDSDFFRMNPPELAETYPIGQSEVPDPDFASIKSAMRNLIEFIKSKNVEATFAYDEEWNHDALAELSSFATLLRL